MIVTRGQTAWKCSDISEARNELAVPHRLCAPCKDICLKSDLLATLPATYERWEEDCNHKRAVHISEPRQERFPHHTFLKFDECRLEGRCHLCAIMWSELEAEAGQHPLGILQAMERSGEAAGMVIVIKHGGRSMVNHCLLSFEIDGQETKTQMQLLISTEPFTAPVTTLFDAQLALSTESDATLELAKRWLNDCLKEHPACTNQRMSSIWPRDLPTRLVKVEMSSKGTILPRLIESNHLESTSPYLTLSHCWGDANFLKLQSDNITKLTNGIPTQELTQTHRDSLVITHRLGYHYIWIDSLCIIQDSIEDWRAESAKMASIYGNTVCNIAAKGATSHAGCFVRRNPLVRRPCRLTQDDAVDPAQTVYAHPYLTAGYQSFNVYSYESDTPLLKRAWVQQERLLPPRILYFGGQEIHWECCSHQASESWPFGSPSDEHGFDEVFPLKAAFESELRPFLEWSNDDYYTFVFELWRNGIVRQYTAAKLTFERDRLAAIAGIAGVIQARTGLSYVAGMWKELLPLELLWCRSGPWMPGESCRNAGAVGGKLPTWSWIPVEGAKSYLITALQHPNLRTETYSCQLVDLATKALDTDTPMMGEFREITLTLKGCLMLNHEPIDYLKQQASKPTPRSASVQIPSIYFDINVADEEELYYFLVTRTNSDTSHTDYGLVLAKDTAIQDGFLRVGVFLQSHDVRSSCLFDGCTERIISIF